MAVSNVNHGLFGIGRIDLDYKFEKQKHDTGSDNPQDFYSHYRKVKWIVTEYHKTNDIMLPNEITWTRHGTLGKLEKSVPPYVLRLLDKHIPIDYNKINGINKAFVGFFANGKNRCEVSDIISDLIEKQLFTQRSGSDFREYLRNLYTLERLNLIPYAHFNMEAASKRWYFKPINLDSNSKEDIELIGYEGKIRNELREHKWIERDLLFKRNFKAKFKDIQQCQSCTLEPKRYYGIEAIEFLELHHVVPLNLRKGSTNTLTRESDVALICPNCHRTIHKLMSKSKNSIVTVSELRRYLEQQ